MVRAGLEAQGLERDAELGRPAGGVGGGGHPPHRVPVRVHVAPFVGDLGVGAGAAGVGREDEAVAAVGEGVEQHFERVLLGGGEVLVDVVHHDARRIGIETAGADVEEGIVVGDEHLGLFGGRLALPRVGLDEVAGRRRPLPQGFVEDAVDDGWCGGADGRERPAAVGGGDGQGLGGGTARRGQGEGQGNPGSQASREHRGDSVTRRRR
ncbi:MAG: hypothetical protein R2708_23595 [Vicinamibacterales bacterium]